MILDDLEEVIQREKLNVYSLGLYERGSYTYRAVAECNEKNNIYSAAKSVTSLIFGILAGRGVLSAEGESVAEIFRGRYVPEHWKDVTPAHLMTHTTGYGAGFLDVDAEDSALWPSRDWLGLSLEHPFTYRPGEKMVYSDSNYYLVSRVISQKTGRGLHTLARELLFDPLDIMATSWAECPQGYAMGATGLFLSIRDMTKLGVMLLQDGKWNGRQIVPQKWIAEMTEKRADMNGSAYGYGFWLGEKPGDYQASGMLGQVIHVSPSRGRVVTIQSCVHDGNLFGKLLNVIA